MFSQSKNLSASTLLNNIKQNQIDKNKVNENQTYINNQMINGLFSENEIFRNNFLLSQMNGFKPNPYINYNQQVFQNNKNKKTVQISSKLIFLNFFSFDWCKKKGRGYSSFFGFRY